MLWTYMKKLVRYGLQTGLITPEDEVFTLNRLLELYQMDAPADAEEYSACEAVVSCDEKGEKKNALMPKAEQSGETLAEILGVLLDCAYQKGLIAENTVGYRDLFDTKIMGALTAFPREIIGKFRADYAVSPKKATDEYFEWNKNINYVRAGRIAKDLKWLYIIRFGVFIIVFKSWQKSINHFFIGPDFSQFAFIIGKHYMLYLLF